MNDSKTSKTGTVYLVGAGPGDPGLITVKGLRCLEAADVVVHDRLVDERLVARASRDAEVIDVGKVPGEGGERQAEINALLVDRAESGQGRRAPERWRPFRVRQGRRGGGSPRGRRCAL